MEKVFEVNCLVVGVGGNMRSGIQSVQLDRSGISQILKITLSQRPSSASYEDLAIDFKQYMESRSGRTYCLVPTGRGFYALPILLIEARDRTGSFTMRANLVNRVDIELGSGNPDEDALGEYLRRLQE